MTTRIADLCAQIEQAEPATKVNLLCLLSDQYLDGRLFESLETARQAHSLARELGDLRGESDSLKCIANVHLMLGEFGEALARYLDALDIIKTLDDQTAVAGLLSNIAVVYGRSGEYQKSLQFSREVMEIQQGVGDQRGLAKTLNNMGLASYWLQRYDEALDYYEKSASIKRAVGDSLGLAASLNNIAMTHEICSRCDQAITLYTEALKIRREAGHKYGIASTLANMAACQVAMGLLDAAAANASEALGIASEASFADLERTARQVLADASDKGGDYKAASEHRRELIELMHKSASEEKARIEAIAKSRYEFVRKEAEIRTLREGAERLEKLVGARTAEIAARTAELETEVIEHRKTFDSYRASQATYGAVFDSVTDAILVVDPNSGVIEEANNSAGLLLADDPRSLVGEHASRFGIPNHPGASSEPNGYPPARAGIRELQVTRADGRCVPVEASLKIADLGKGERMIAVLRDVTDRRRLEQQLHLVDKMRVIGQLASGVAHDLNNMLAGIAGYADLIAGQSKENPKVLRYAESIRDSTMGVAELTSQLLTFSREGAGKTIPVDIHRVVEDVVGLLTHTLDRRIKLVKDLKASRRIVLGEVSRLQNAILNLAVNARDAMPDGGLLTISTDLVTGSGEDSDKPMIAISVRDTGKGIPPDIVDRIFEPFFTTKEPGKGTGLGLATVYGTATAMGGSIKVASEPGVGSEFVITIPLSAKELRKPLPSLPQTTQEGKGCVLVVDDEDAVRMLLRDVLSRVGYRVLTAPDAEKGLEVFRKESGRIDLVILDVVLPGKPAVTAFKELREFDPGAQVLFISGLRPDAKVSQLVADGVADFLQKPFVSGDLVGKLVKLQAGKR